MKKIYTVLIIVVMMLFVGCSKDFLDRESLTGLSDETFWTTEADAEMALAGCYSNLQSPFLYDSSPYQGGVQRWDYMTDDGYVNWGWMAGGAVSRGEHSTNDGFIRNTWQQCYQTIVRCNRVIETVPTLGQDIIDDTYASQIVAEAKFIRVLIYNLMSMTFENVPLITALQAVEEAQVAVSPKADIVNFILSDLGDAVKDLPDPGTEAWGRATKGAGYALLARVNLYNENWTEAATWAQKTIDLGYTLFPDFGGLFQEANETNDEVIFSVGYMRGPDEDGGNFAGYWGSNGINYHQALNNLGEDYFCTDGQLLTESPLYRATNPVANRDPRMGVTLVTDSSTWNGAMFNMGKTKTGVLQRKYGEEHNTENHFDGPTDFIVFRLGEVLLMKAEALAQSGSSAEVFALINQLRDRTSVQMPHVDQTEVDTYFDGDLLKMVQHERRIETAFEGLRYLDLKRWGLLKERAIDFYMEYEVPKHPKLSNRYWVGPQQLIWPIPQTEIDVNPALVQNPGW